MAHLVFETEESNPPLNNPNEQAILDKLKALPPERVAEVKDFVDFLATREARTAAGARLGESLARLEALNLPPLSDEEIEAEIQAAR